MVPRQRGRRAAQPAGPSWRTTVAALLPDDLLILSGQALYRMVRAPQGPPAEKLLHLIMQSNFVYGLTPRSLSGRIALVQQW